MVVYGVSFCLWLLPLALAGRQLCPRSTFPPYCLLTDTIQTLWRQHLAEAGTPTCPLKAGKVHVNTFSSSSSSFLPNNTISSYNRSITAATAL